MYIDRKQKELTNKRLRTGESASSGFSKRKRTKTKIDDKDYGPNIAEVFMDDQALQMEISNLINRLKVTIHVIGILNFIVYAFYEGDKGTTNGNCQKICGAV